MRGSGKRRRGKSEKKRSERGEGEGNGKEKKYGGLTVKLMIRVDEKHNDKNSSLPAHSILYFNSTRSIISC